MIITITGMPGSGKTTVVKSLAESLQVPWYSVGDLRGKMARERGMTIDEFNVLGEKEAFTDKEVDEYQTKLGLSGEAFVIDGRLSWHFIPNSLKVFLDVDEDEAAKRIFHSIKSGQRPDEKMRTSVDEVKHAIKERITSDQTRYQKYYQLDFLDKSNYDLVIDTTKMSQEEVCRKILELIHEK